MTWKILQLAFPLVFLGIAFHLYRKNRTTLVGFREQLAVSPKGRRFVALMALLTLLVYHFIALCGTANPLQLLPSSILAFMLFSQRCGEGILHVFQSKRWQFLAFVVTLAAFFHPISTPMAVTLLVLMITSWVYPTEALIKEASERGDTSDIIEETIEGLREEMENINAPIFFDENDVPEEVTDVDTEPANEEPSPSSDVEEDVSDASPVSDMPSDKAIRNQKMRERERERRHSRAKRRARRAKRGH